MSLNVLTSPMEVRAVIDPIFPAAQYRGVVAESGFSLEVTLPRTEPFSITTCIDALQFVPDLQKLARQTFVDTRLDLPPSTLVIKKFTLAAPLVEWQKFQRAVYESTGKKCEDVLISYLSDIDTDSSLGVLKSLGLSPQQIGNSCGADDLPYFQSVMEQLKSGPQEKATQMFSKLIRDYPLIGKSLVRKMEDRDSKEGKKGENQRSVILNNLKSMVVGQNPAAELLATTLASQQRQNGNAVFLFVGPTGVGKTEMAKAIASIKQGRMVTLAMNQYQSEHNVSNLLGSPPGYVGSTDKPHFAQQIDQYATQAGKEGRKELCNVENVVILFDELEKAHSRVKQSLLTLFDEGHITVQYSRDKDNVSIKYSLQKCILIGTSNLYQQPILEAFRAGADVTKIADRFVLLNREAPHADSYSPEFLGRLKVIPFGPIPKGASYQSLVSLKMKAFLEEIRKEIGCHSVGVEKEEQVLQILENAFYGEGVDIRRIKKYFEQNVKTVVYSEMEKWGDISNKRLIFVPYDREKLGIKVARIVFENPVDVLDAVPIA